MQDVTPATPAREDAGAIIDARRNAVVDPTFPPPASQESGPIVPSASELANAATAAASNNGEGEGEGDGATRPSEETARPSAQGNGNSGSGGGGDGDGAIGTTGLVLEGVNPTVNTGAADEEVGALVEGASLADPLDERTGAVGTLFDDRAAAGNLQVSTLSLFSRPFFPFPPFPFFAFADTHASRPTSPYSFPSFPFLP